MQRRSQAAVVEVTMMLVCIVALLLLIRVYFAWSKRVQNAKLAR